MVHPKRKRVFVDADVQGAFLVRTVAYWLICLISVGMVQAFWKRLASAVNLMDPNADGFWIQYGPGIVISVLMLPIIAYDMLRLSNRLVGPLIRLRRAMRRLADGEQVDPVHFRNGDFWRDMANEFNAVVARCQNLQKQVDATRVHAEAQELVTTSGT